MGRQVGILAKNQPNRLRNKQTGTFAREASLTAFAGDLSAALNLARRKFAARCCPGWQRRRRRPIVEKFLANENNNSNTTKC